VFLCLIFCCVTAGVSFCLCLYVIFPLVGMCVLVCFVPAGCLCVFVCCMTDCAMYVCCVTASVCFVY
jgi:hypothetical protein